MSFESVRVSLTCFFFFWFLRGGLRMRADYARVTFGVHGKFQIAKIG